MLIRTHLAIIVLAILLFLPSITDKFLFIAVALIATFLPDLDSGFATISKIKTLGFFHYFVKHRTMLHSFTFAIVISLILAFFLPIVALAFFLGYSLHVFADSFTIDGIRPFWPLKRESKWHFRTGSRVETTFFIILILLDIFVFILLVRNVY